MHNRCAQFFCTIPDSSSKVSPDFAGHAKFKIFGPSEPQRDEALHRPPEPMSPGCTWTPRLQIPKWFGGGVSGGLVEELVEEDSQLLALGAGEPGCDR